MSNCWADSSGVATVGHGWARANPTSARVGREICTNSEFFGGVGWGSRLHMSLKVHRISSINTSRKCVCPLQIVYAYLAFGAFAPTSPQGLCPWTPLRDFHPPNSLCPPYLQTLATPLFHNKHGVMHNAHRKKQQRKAAREATRLN